MQLEAVCLQWREGQRQNTVNETGASGGKRKSQQEAATKIKEKNTAASGSLPVAGCGRRTMETATLVDRLRKPSYVASMVRHRRRGDLHCKTRHASLTPRKQPIICASIRGHSLSEMRKEKERGRE